MVSWRGRASASAAPRARFTWAQISFIRSRTRRTRTAPTHWSRTRRDQLDRHGRRLCHVRLGGPLRQHHLHRLHARGYGPVPNIFLSAYRWNVQQNGVELPPSARLLSVSLDSVEVQRVDASTVTVRTRGPIRRRGGRALSPSRPRPEAPRRSHQQTACRDPAAPREATRAPRRVSLNGWMEFQWSSRRTFLRWNKRCRARVLA